MWKGQNNREKLSNAGLSGHVPVLAKVKMAKINFYLVKNCK